MYIFLRESKIILEYGGRYINLDTTSEVSCSQTFKETSIDRRTLHSRNQFLKMKRIRANNTISCSLSLYITRTYLELIFFELAGWTHFDYGLAYPDFESNIPETFNLYFVNAEQTYRLTDCVITTIDLSMNKTFCGAVNIGINAAELEKVNSVNASLVQGSALYVSALKTIFGREEFQAISAGISFTRELSYLNSETIHNSSDIISSNRCIIVDSNISVNVSAYQKSPIIDSIDSITISQSGLSLFMNNALITKRDSIGSELIQTSFDISPTENTNTITLLI